MTRRPILIIFRMQHQEITWRGLNSNNFAKLTLILLLHYLVKCRSHSLAVNNKFILGSAMPQASSRSR